MPLCWDLAGASVCPNATRLAALVSCYTWCPQTLIQLVSLVIKSCFSPYHWRVIDHKACLFTFLRWGLEVSVTKEWFLPRKRKNQDVCPLSEDTYCLRGILVSLLYHWLACWVSFNSWMRWGKVLDFPEIIFLLQPVNKILYVQVNFIKILLQEFILLIFSILFPMVVSAHLFVQESR